ncbi:MAG: 4-alpha-glucanotransferase [Acidobacteriota bacterium]
MPADDRRAERPDLEAPTAHGSALTSGPAPGAREISPLRPADGVQRFQTPRRAGILLHPTALPGPHGIGDLGPGAHRFLDWLHDAGQSVWQMLPLGPPAAHGVPYSALSSHALNPALVALEPLVEAGWLEASDLEPPSEVAGDGRAVAFGRVGPWKRERLRRAFDQFRALPGALGEEHVRFVGENPWLATWELFVVARARHGGRPWWRWPKALRRREPDALDALRRDTVDERACERFIQWLAHRQLAALRAAARSRGIVLMGDLPIYVARDSVDVWSYPDLFDLEDDGAPRHVAGVPPDAFSDDGQLWGNPLYRWSRHADEGFAWWTERLRAALAAFDLLRLDHFRAFSAYWQVPADAQTARDGRWVEGPGLEFFRAIERALDAPALVAEDLGDIDEAVHVLRRAAGLPGMRVLQFGFEDEPNLHSPHRHAEDCVVYSGTHDNDTARGWYDTLDQAARDRFERVASLDRLPATERAEHAADALVRLALGSVARLSIVPLQDVLGLDSSARFNRPGEARGWWRWRLASDQLDEASAARLRALTRLFERLSTSTAPAPAAAPAAEPNTTIGEALDC